MSEYEIDLVMNEFVTHDVRRLLFTRPSGFTYVPGQAVKLSVWRDEWRDEKRPFSPTNHHDDLVVELHVKRYHQEGLPDLLHELSPGSARVRMSEPFGAITYKGRGTFIAAGTGVTPFLAILRERARAGDLEGQTLLLSNKTPEDVIAEKELRHMLGNRCVLTCTRAGEVPGYRQGRIDGDLIAEHGLEDRWFYLCGPDGFVRDMQAALSERGVDGDRIVVEG